MEKFVSFSKERGETFRFYCTVLNYNGYKKKILLLTNSSFYILNHEDLKVDESNSWFTLRKIKLTENKFNFLFSCKSVIFETEKTKEISNILYDILPRILTPTELISLGYFNVAEEIPPPTPSSIFLRIKEKPKSLNIDISNKTINRFFKIITYAQEYVDLDAFENPYDAVSALLDIIPITSTIRSISISSMENSDAYELLNDHISEFNYLEHIKIKGKATKHFASFLRHLSKNTNVPMYGLTFQDTQLTETKVKALVKYMSDKYICSVGFSNAFEDNSKLLYTTFLPQMQKKLVLLSLDETKGINLENLFNFGFPALEIISLRKCGLEISKIFECISLKNLPQLKGINVGENVSNEFIKESLTMPLNLSTVSASGVKWKDGAFLAMFKFLQKSFTKDLRLDVSNSFASSTEWRHLLTFLSEATLPALKSLIWSYNPHGSRFASFIKNNSQLEFLNVSYVYNEKSRSEVEALGEFVAHSNINGFVVRGNAKKYVGETLVPLLKNLSKSRKLEYLDVSGSNGHDKVIAELKSLLQSDVPLRFVSFDGIAPQDPNVLFDLLYSEADNSKSTAISFPADDLERLQNAGVISEQQVNWAKDLYKLPQPTINDQPSPFEYPFEIYKENYEPPFPLFIKPLSPSPDGIKTEDMVNTNVFSEERTNFTISMSGDQFNLVPIPKETKEEPRNDANVSEDTYELTTKDAIKNDVSKETKVTPSESDNHGSSAQSKGKHSKTHKRRKGSLSKGSKKASIVETHSKEANGSQKKRTKKHHRKEKEVPKEATVDIYNCDWTLPIKFDLSEVVAKVISTANKTNNLDDLVDSIPK